MAAVPEPARHLRAVDENTGEVFATPREAELQALVDKLTQDRKNLEKDLRAKRRKITELERDLVREREVYPDREKILRIHSYWNRRMGHDQALTADRFDAVRGMLEELKLVRVEGKSRAQKVPAFSYPDDFKRAIDGGWFDPFVTKQKNGREKRHNDLALICRDGKTFQSFIDRAPLQPEA